MSKNVLLIAVLVLVMLLIAGCAGKEGKPVAAPAGIIAYPADKLVVAGSGTNLPITGQLVEAYKMKYGAAVEMPPSIGTDGAIIAVKSGALELGLVSRPLTAKEAEGEIKILPYARVGILFAVQPVVPDDNMTFADLLQIYQGTRTTWSNGKPIVVIMREKYDSSNMELYQKIPGWEAAVAQSINQKRWYVAYKDVDGPVAIRALEWSMGLTDSSEVFKKDSRLKALRVNGVVPTLETIADGSYPLSKLLYFIYKEPLTNRTKQFIDFVESAEGRKLIREHGGVPER